MGRMDSFETQSSKRKSTIKSSERKSIIQSVGAPSIQVSVVSDSETENKSEVEMKDFRKSQRKTRNTTILASQPKNDEGTRELVNDSAVESSKEESFIDLHDH